MSTDTEERHETPTPRASGVRFVGESIRLVVGTQDVAGMAAGGPGLPRQFIWRGVERSVATVLRTWRDTAPCRHGSGERYANRHWYEVRTDQGDILTLYFERRPRRGTRAASPRWHLFTTRSASGEERP